MMMMSMKKIVRICFAFALFEHAVGLSPVSLERACSAQCSALFASTSAASQNDDRKKAIVVGGGPVGLTTALTLSNPPHSYDVTLMEQTVAETSVSKYDPTKAYLYLVNARGQKAFKNFPIVMDLLKERGSVNDFSKFGLVPSDPSKPLPQPKVAKVRATSSETKAFATNTDINYWIPRHSMVQLLEDVIAKQEKSRQEGSNNTLGAINVVYGKKFESMRPNDDVLEVTVQDSKSPDVRYRQTFTANLVVGADGINSGVRCFLAEDSQISATSVPMATSPSMASWLTLEPKKFRVRRYVSPATGLRMKILQFPPGFSIPDSDGSLVQTEGERPYGIRSIYTGPKNYVSLGLLPVKDPTQVRSCNVITRPNHDIWTLKDAESNKSWFTKAFPRLDFDQLVNDKEWERFAHAAGTTFPHVQYSPGLQMSSPNGKAGVVLVGDSSHAFPPDIGQGINAGLSDVVALDHALRGDDIVTGKAGEAPTTLGEALRKFERVRSPENKALIKLARFGAPYQYKQPLRKDRIGRFLWTTNILIRTLINKLSFGIVPPPAIIMSQNKDLTFRQIMRRADLTTAGFTAVVLSALWLKFRETIFNFVKATL